MKLSQKYLGGKGDLVEFLHNLADQIQEDALVVQTEHVAVPGDAELEYKLKFNMGEKEAELAFKIKWPVATS